MSEPCPDSNQVMVDSCREENIFCNSADLNKLCPKGANKTKIGNTYSSFRCCTSANEREINVDGKTVNKTFLDEKWKQINNFNEKCPAVYCPPGYTRHLPNNECIKCEKGKFNTDGDKCKDCDPKPLNSEWVETDGKTCKWKCLDNYYQNGNRCDVWTNCGPGYIVDDNGDPSINKNRICKKCPVGTYKEGNDNLYNCTDCPSGQYQDKEGQSKCKKCPNGTYSDKIKNTKESDCLPCHTDNPNDNKSCKDIGKYSNCPAGTNVETITLFNMLYPNHSKFIKSYHNM